MANDVIKTALSEKENTYKIDLMNKVTGSYYNGVILYGTNTLGQVVQEYGKDIGVNPNDRKIIFENKRTGMSTSDLGETVESIGLQEGDVLVVSDNAGVA